jgi:outer membrane protein assembly factor BamB
VSAYRAHGALLCPLPPPPTTAAPKLPRCPAAQYLLPSPRAAGAAARPPTLSLRGYQRETPPGIATGRRRATLRAAAAAAAALATGADGQPAPGAPWPQRGGGPRHTGRSPHDGPASATLKWAAQLGGGGAQVRSSPAVAADGTVYVGSSTGELRAVNGTSGRTRWAWAAAGALHASPALTAGGLVVVGSYDHAVYALDAGSGALVWNLTTGGAVASSPALTADGGVVVTSWDGKVRCLDAATGGLRWAATVGIAMDSSPAVDDAGRAVYVGAWSGRVHALNASTGAALWTAGPWVAYRGVSSSPALAPAAAGGGPAPLVYVGCDDGKVRALNATTGAVVWAQTTGDRVFSSPAYLDRGSGGGDGSGAAPPPPPLVVVGSVDGTVYGLDAATGALVWAAPTGGPVYSSPSIDARGAVYVGSDDGRLYALNGPTGAALWSAPTGGPVASSPALGANGAAYVGSNDGRLYAFGSPPWVEPSPTGSATPGATPSGSASRTRAASRTRTATGSPLPQLCPGLGGAGSAVRLLSGLAGSAPRASTAGPAALGGLFVVPGGGGACATGYGAFPAGRRLAYAVDLPHDAPLGGVLAVSTCASAPPSNDTLLWVGVGCPASAAAFGCVAGNDDAAPACGANARASAATVVGVARRRYYVLVGGAGGGDVTAGLRWAYAPPSASPSPLAEPRMGGGVWASRSRTPSRSRSRSRSRTRSRTRKVKV